MTGGDFGVAGIIELEELKTCIRNYERMKDLDGGGWGSTRNRKTLRSGDIVLEGNPCG